jgi:hypothetical protein
MDQAIRPLSDNSLRWHLVVKAGFDQTLLRTHERAGGTGAWQADAGGFQT